jgi:hypothetical protein
MKTTRFAVALTILLSAAVTAFAKVEPPCPRVVVEFERCNPGDPCHLVYVHPHTSPDAKVEAIEGTPYILIRENGGTGTEWETIGSWLAFEGKWASLFDANLYDRVTVRPDPACQGPTKAPKTTDRR